MKKKLKRLVLAKETLRKLTPVELGQVAGGTDGSMCWSHVDFSCQDEFTKPTANCG